MNMAPSTDPSTEGLTHTLDIVVSNKLGLHARASAKLTQLASRYVSEIHIARSAKRVNAPSIMGAMMRAAGKGTTVTVDARRPAGEAAPAAIKTLFGGRFGEAEG